MRIVYSAISDRGPVRSENQDTIYISSRYVNEEHFTFSDNLDGSASSLFAVFDGMGGELCGKEASVLAAQTLATFPVDTPLETICLAMNDQICRYMKENDIKNMGSTAAVVRLNGDTIEFCNIGDSRIYLIDGLNMYRLSKDHTVEIPGYRKALTQHLGIPKEEILIEPHIGKTTVKRGSTVLLCSDGLTDYISEPEIGKTIITNTLPDAAELLKSAALHYGGKDNFSMILIQLQ